LTRSARGTDAAAPPVFARLRRGKTLRWASAFAVLRRDKPDWPQRGHCHQALKGAVTNMVDAVGGA